MFKIHIFKYMLDFLQLIINLEKLQWINLKNEINMVQYF